MARNTLRNADRLDDLEDCGTAHHEDEQRQQPRTNGVLLLGVLRRLGHVSALGDVAAGLLVGHADSLLGGHCAFVCCCWGWVERANHKSRCSKSEQWKLLFCAELLFRMSEIVQVLFSLVFIFVWTFPAGGKLKALCGLVTRGQDNYDAVLHRFPSVRCG